MDSQTLVPSYLGTDGSPLFYGDDPTTFRPWLIRLRAEISRNRKTPHYGERRLLAPPDNSIDVEQKNFSIPTTDRAFPDPFVTVGPFGFQASQTARQISALSQIRPGFGMYPDFFFGRLFQGLAPWSRAFRSGTSGRFCRQLMPGPEANSDVRATPSPSEP